MCMYLTPTYMQYTYTFWNTYTYAHAGSLMPANDVGLPKTDSAVLRMAICMQLGAGFVSPLPTRFEGSFENADKI
jgi:hypothetical protein